MFSSVPASNKFTFMLTSATDMLHVDAILSISFKYHFRMNHCLGLEEEQDLHQRRRACKLTSLLDDLTVLLAVQRKGKMGKLLKLSQKT